MRHAVADVFALRVALRDAAAPGMIVGARRWPNVHAHPSTWGRPWKGTVLSLTDPRAWAGTLAFPCAEPDPEAVRRHVAWCQSIGLLSDVVPVLWEFGRVWFEHDARPYPEDLAAWNVERKAAEAREARGVRTFAAVLS